MLRKGMWVVSAGKVGILNAMGPRAANPAKGETELAVGQGELHLVDANGDTATILPSVSLSALAQAAYDDIPPPRRPSQSVARALGYLA